MNYACGEVDSAIVETGGTQYWFESGRFYDINRLVGVEPGDKISFNKVLFVKNGEDVRLGTPRLENVTVNAIVMRHYLGSKLAIFKMQPKKRSRFKIGFRRKITRVLIDSIQIK
jgi:large subunit ribosomal protein L21